jgi:group I intron endonuclease
MIKSGIYAFLNLETGMFYIGSTIDFYKRYHSHKSLLNNGKHDNSYFQRAWTKYGQINFIFVILEYVEDISKLEKVEQKWLDNTQCYDRNIGYNVRCIANSSLGILHTQETKDKISKAKTGFKHNEKSRANMTKNSANRNKNKWPCPDKSKCKCESCKEIHRIRNRQHSREWRASNRLRYNEYMRNYNAAC